MALMLANYRVAVSTFVFVAILFFHVFSNVSRKNGNERTKFFKVASNLYAFK